MGTRRSAALAGLIAALLVAGVVSALVARPGVPSLAALRQDVTAALDGEQAQLARLSGDPQAGELLVDVLVSSPVGAVELEALARRVAAVVGEELDYRSLTVGFNDRQAYVGHGHALGYWLDLPGAEGGPVSALRDADWSQRPSEADVERWVRWRDALGDGFWQTAGSGEGPTTEDWAAAARVSGWLQGKSA